MEIPPPLHEGASPTPIQIEDQQKAIALTEVQQVMETVKNASTRDPVFQQKYQNGLRSSESVPNTITDTGAGIVNAPFDLVHGAVTLPVGIYNVTQKPEDRYEVPSFSPFKAPRTGLGKTANVIAQFAIPYGMAGKGLKAAGLFQGGKTVATKAANAAARGLIEGTATDLVLDHESDKQIRDALLDELAEDPQAARKITAMLAPTYLEDKLTAAVHDAPMNIGFDVASTLIGGWWKARKLVKGDEVGAVASVEKPVEAAKPNPNRSTPKATPASTWERPTYGQAVAYLQRFGQPLDGNSIPLYDRLTPVAKNRSIDLSRHTDLEDDLMLEAHQYLASVVSGKETSGLPSILEAYKTKYPMVDSSTLWADLVASLTPQVQAIKARKVTMEGILKNVRSPFKTAAAVTTTPPPVKPAAVPAVNPVAAGVEPLVPVTQ